ncbi:F-box/LRR-repeat/kelch-repeat protein At2g27520-like [Asparagus officinalis]|uniref:F-box/LRR-repeat/kelch-repeat protein At2g27520-like n=1 Tax=Asparagus officinalis TaxID=4686 RepID=UPI00098E0A7D|nr:F-box/LRR-repeat/kelch-repeat protein At2g27520-like [Asparagus officinalis]
MLASNFGNDLIFNILVWIPAVILHGRLRCVCKQWLHMIRDPVFVQAHLAKAKSKPSLYCAARYQPHNFRYLVIDEDQDVPPTVQTPIMMLASCDGLVLVADSWRARSLAVVNPITRKCLQLPYFSNGYPSKTRGGIVFDCQRKEYKVVVFYSFSVCQPFQCKILTPKSGDQMAWRRVDCPFQRFEWFKPPVDANGALYWSDYDRRHLISMEVVSDIAEFRRIEMPTAYGPLGHPQLIKMGDKLSVSITDETSYHTLLLDDDRSREQILWSRKQTFPLDSRHKDAVIIGSLRDGNVIILKFGGTWDFMAIDHVGNKGERCSMMDDDQSILCSTVVHVNSLTSWGDLDCVPSKVGRLKESWMDNCWSIFDHLAFRERTLKEEKAPREC